MATAADRRPSRLPNSSRKPAESAGTTGMSHANPSGEPAGTLVTTSVSGAAASAAANTDISSL